MRAAFIIYCILLLSVKVAAQTDSLKFDPNYYERYPYKLIISPFLVKSYNGLALATPGVKEDISYISNSPAGVGLRAGYDWFSVSASYGISAIDKNYKSKGKTKALNLQTNFMARNFVVDVYFQKYSGMYLRGGNLPAYNAQPYYIRPDIDNKLLGVSASWVFNGKKFSIRPPFKFDGWQKKSAGSFLAGVEYLMGSVQSDSAFIPAAYKKDFAHSNVNKLKYTLFGPNVGYGHTFVIGRHFFVSALGTFNADVSHTQEFSLDNAVSRRWNFAPNIYFRGGIGYNTPAWEVAFSYFTKRLYLSGMSHDNRYRNYNDDYRLSYTRRVHPGKRIPKAVDWAGNIIEKLGLGFLIK